MTFVRTPATPRKPFGSALSSLGPPFPPFGLPANQESFHSYLGSSTFWNPAQQGALGDSAEDVKVTPLRIWSGSVADVGITSLVVIRISWPAGHLEIRNFASADPISMHRSCRNNTASSSRPRAAGFIRPRWISANAVRAFRRDRAAFAGLE